MKFAIFDLDGTLIDTIKPHVDSFIAVADKYGIKTQRTEIEAMFGMRAKEIYTMLINQQNLDLDPNQLALEKYHFMEANLPPFEVLPGVKELLNAFQSNGIKMGIATGTGQTSLVERMLELVELKEYFTAIVSAENVAMSKPDPEIYLKAISALDPNDEYPKSEFIAFEDSTYGVQSAHNAGLKCVAIVTGRSTKDELANENPHILVDTLKDIDADSVLN